MWLVKGVIGLAFIAFMVFMMIEWVAGCGETYTDSKGRVHINECTFTTIKK
jgi:hypothetical protein